MKHLQSASWAAIDMAVYDLREEIAMTFDREFDDLPPLSCFDLFADCATCKLPPLDDFDLPPMPDNFSTHGLYFPDFDAFDPA